MTWSWVGGFEGRGQHMRHLVERRPDRPGAGSQEHGLYSEPSVEGRHRTGVSQPRPSVSCF